MGRIGWQGSIGMGMGAWQGASSGEDWRDRANKSLNDAAIGTGLGLVGGALGEGITAGVNKLLGKPVTGAAKQALQQAGINPSMPIKDQADAVISGLERTTGTIIPSEYAGAVTREAATGALQTGAEKALGVKNASIEALNRSLSLDAQLSSDAIGGVAQSIAKGIESPIHGAGRVNLAYTKQVV
jgi:hypothetical protein